MVFSSTVFLFCFLPGVFLTYWIVRQGLRLYVLLIASLLFYAWGEPDNVIWLLSVAIVSYFSALMMEEASTPKKRLFYMASAVFLNLSLLFRYKYLDFFLQVFGNIIGYTFTPHHYVLPIGISFFTFQALSYVIDVYRHEVEVQRNFLHLALYVSFFPQLIAGPIVKYHDILQDIENNYSCFADIVSGTKRFIVGLGKKVLVANSLSITADRIFDTGATYADCSIAWLGAITYSLQLYFDFSGYSDMAIGLGRIFGFHFKENFEHPYLSQSISEFWRRWHISLGAWFREYLYIPLGGNRKGAVRTYFNLLFVFLVTGLWHGAAWTFVVWGLWHGLFVVLEHRFVSSGGTTVFLKLLRHGYTILIFTFGWVMFRASSITDGLGFWLAMVGLYSPDVMPFTLEYYITWKLILVLSVAIIGCTIYGHTLLTRVEASSSVAQRAIANVYLLVIFCLSIVFLVASTYNPFIYFRF